MKALLLKRLCDLAKVANPLEFVRSFPIPTPEEDEVLLRVLTCGFVACFRLYSCSHVDDCFRPFSIQERVCHTELDEIEGRTPPPELPVILGHQAVGIVEKLPPSFSELNDLELGDRVGVAWINWACGECSHCRAGAENLCKEFRATGRDVNGGYAEYMTVDPGFVYKIPDMFSDAEAAPLLCAGAIGYRSLSLCELVEDEYDENPLRLGLTGFGASAHLCLQLAHHLYPGIEVFVFARSAQEREFALELGAVWAGEASDDVYLDDEPVELDAIIDTTPVWNPIVEGLRRLRPGGRLVINAIRKEESDKVEALSVMDYASMLWMEKSVKSVANVTRRDVAEFLEVAAEIPIVPEVEEFPMEEANRALRELKTRKIRGAKVLRISEA